MPDVLRSIAKVADVEYVRGERTDPDAPPDLFFELPHGATAASHFDELQAELVGTYDPGLRDFFFVNTDVGSPELARAVARKVVAAQPERTAVLVRCLLPRTFLDCNRTIDRDTVAAASQAGEMTPGLQPWVVDSKDRELLLDRYFAYRGLVAEGFAQVCGDGGTALCVHTYAPRSIDVAVDENIAASLHAAYALDRIESWPLRAEVDLITHDPDGNELADPVLSQRAEQAWIDAGLQVARNQTYALHPSTLAFEFAQRYPHQTLCFEVRRDLLLAAFVPFVELHASDDAVQRVAAPLALALSK